MGHVSDGMGDKSKPWTNEEETLLKKLASEGVTRSQIAAKLNRTTDAVQKKAERMSVSLPCAPAPKSPLRVTQDGKIENGNAKSWTNDEIILLKKLAAEGLTRLEIAEKLNRSSDSVLTKATRMGIKLPRGPYATEPPKKVTMKGEIENAKLLLEKDRVKSLEKVNKQLAKQAAETERLADVYKDSLAGMQIRFPDVSKISSKRHHLATGTKTPEVGVLVLSDLHIGKTVIPDETNGYGRYNMLQALRKAEYLLHKVILLRQQGFVRINKLFVLLLGDLIEGQLDHAEELPGREYLVDQINLATLLLAQMLGGLASHFEVSVHGLGGNHARYPNQKKPPTTGRRSNYDTVVLNNLASTFWAVNGGLIPPGSGPRKNIFPITFDIARAQDLVVNINRHCFCLSHGDELKGGDKALGVPAHAIGRKISSWAQRRAAFHQTPISYFVVGDKHRQMALPTAGGSFMINGAWPGVDPYSLAGSFSPNRPSQLFFGVHPKFGKSWDYTIYLDDRLVGEKPLKSLGFHLPPDLTDAVTAYSR